MRLEPLENRSDWRGKRMSLRGLHMLGTFLSSEQVRYGESSDKAGQPVPGFYRMTIGIGTAWDGELMTRQLSYNATDRDTGQPTPIAEQVANLTPGTEVAVLVRPKAPRNGRTWVDLEPISVTVLAAPANEAA